MNARETPSEGQTYTQILKSTALIGGSSLITVGFSIIRNKAMALILGPEGVGLMAIYSSIADIAQAVAGLGVQSSGVRQIAEAVGTGDAEKLRELPPFFNEYPSCWASPALCCLRPWLFRSRA